MLIPALVALATLIYVPTGTPVESGVAWYGDWDVAVAEAKRSERPIILQFARPACQGISGVF